MIGQLAHLAFPLAAGEAGTARRPRPAGRARPGHAANAGPAAGEAVSAERLEGFGRAVLSAVDALDTAPDVPHALQTGVLIQHQALPAWARAPARGRAAARTAPRSPSTRSPACAAAASRSGAGRCGPSPARSRSCCARCSPICSDGWASAPLPRPPCCRARCPFDGSAPARAVLAVRARARRSPGSAGRSLVRRLGLSVRPSSEAAGLAMLLVLLAICLVVWAVDPFTALLLLPALHLFLLIVSPELPPAPARQRSPWWRCALLPLAAAHLLLRPSARPRSRRGRVDGGAARSPAGTSGSWGRCCGASRSAAWPPARCSR